MLSPVLPVLVLLAAGTPERVQLDMPPPPALKAPARKSPPIPAAPPHADPAPVSTPAASPAIKVAVFEPQVAGEVPPRPLAVFRQALPTEVRKLEGVNALSASDIQELLGRERLKEVLGCSDASSSCMAEITGALDADETISIELTLVNGTYALSARRIDGRHARVIQSLTKRFEKKDGEELLAQVGPVVQALYPERALKPGLTRGVAAEAARKLNPPPLPRWAFFTGAGLTVAATGTGAAFGLFGQTAQKQYNALAQGALSTPVQGSQLVALAHTAKTDTELANALFITGGALAVATGIAALFTDWSGDRAASLSAGPVALTTGHGELLGGVALSGTF